MQQDLTQSNGWFGEIRCAGKNVPLHTRGNAASALAAPAKGGFVRAAGIWPPELLHIG